MALVYDELRAMARRQLRHRRPGQTITTTALVHEAYLKLVNQEGTPWQDRSTFSRWRRWPCATSWWTPLGDA